MMCGGASANKPVDPEHAEWIIAERANVQARGGDPAFECFEPVHCTTQVVAGIMMQVCVKVNEGEWVHVKFFKPLPHTGNPVEIKEFARGKTLEDPFAF